MCCSTSILEGRLSPANHPTPAGLAATRLYADLFCRQGVHTVLDIRAAIRQALGHAEPGDLIIVGCASQLSELREALGNVDLVPVDAATLSACDDLSPTPPANAGTPIAEAGWSLGAGHVARQPQADLSFQP